MKPTDYTYAVARVRANEARLLTSQELNSLIAAPNYAECARRLREKGYEISGTDYPAALEARLAAMWQLLSEILPEPRQFGSILIGNDFHNLKVCLKALFSGRAPEELFASPSLYDPNEIKKCVFSRENGLLPAELQHADRSAYRILTKTGFAQLADTVIDRAALEHAVAFAKAADNPLLVTFAETRAALTDIKVLYRCILTGKAASFMERAVCACPAFEKGEIIAAAEEGMEAFLGFVSHTPFAAGAEALRESAGRYETYMDDTLLALLSPGKSDPFGSTALAGYYFAVRTEVLNLRVLLSGKLNGVPDEEIRERMRRLYV